MKVLLVALFLLLPYQGNERELETRIVKLEKTVAKLEKYYNVNAGTETPMASNEQAIVDDLIKLKKAVRECCNK